MAMLAGLPKAPASFNPVVNPERAKLRQMYILRRMHDLHYITNEQFDMAQNEPIQTKQIAHRQMFAVNASYVAEMVRQEMYDRYQDDAYTQGYSVYTTIRAQDQAIAYASVRKGVMEYDHRHGYRGPEGYVDLKKNNTDEMLEDALEDVPDSDDLVPAVVQSINPKGISAHCKGGQIVEIRGEGLNFAQQTLGNKLALNHRIRVGSLIRVYKNDRDFWEITQLPQIESAFVSANPRDGAIYALVGGFDFYRNQFNHVTQAWRQPGSSFKPFIYSAALEKGFTPASVINDAPLVIDLAQTGEELWQPKNYEGGFDGPMRLRQGLVRSKNLVSIRILQAIGLEYAQDYVTKFGFDKDKIKPFLTMALGAGSVTPLQLMGGYSVFANGGYRIMPYFIQRIEDGQGKLVGQAAPVVAGEGAEQVIDVRNAFTMVNMMQDVVKHGTAMRAMELGRQDLAGKTGTTSDSMDAWFAGFHPTLVAVTWIGYDNPQSLGEKETGGGAALPIWMGYMEKMLKGVPEVEYSVPEHVISVRINENGLRDPNGNRTEYFYEENPPPEQGETTPEGNKPAETNDQLF